MSVTEFATYDISENRKFVPCWMAAAIAKVISSTGTSA